VRALQQRCHPVRDHAYDGRDRDPQTSDARNAAHLIRAHGDPGKPHVRSVTALDAIGETISGVGAVVAASSD
jgi:hypothetical protein